VTRCVPATPLGECHPGWCAQATKPAGNRVRRLCSGLLMFAAKHTPQLTPVRPARVLLLLCCGPNTSWSFLLYAHDQLSSCVHALLKRCIYSLPISDSLQRTLG
jgi:hypothetical protein